MQYPAAMVRLILLAGLACAAAPCLADTAPTREGCAAAIQRARTMVGALKAGSQSRRFADYDLVQAQAEAGNGEFDDCLEYAGKAQDEALHPHHLPPAAMAPKQGPRGNR